MNAIFPSTYSRTDGKVVAIKLEQGWVLRCIRGPSWFWNHVTRAWDISCVSGFRTDDPRYTMPEAEAVALLPTIEPVSDDFRGSPSEEGEPSERFA